jgi:6,7-dimethyl-8-ribityllumazine synthase
MSSADKNLSIFASTQLPDLSAKKFAVVVSEWNDDVTGALYQGAVDTLKQYGIPKENIITRYVPGSYELSLGAQWMAEQASIDAVICIGCVIQGDTKHFGFICDAVAHGITNVSLKYNKPVIFGVLTPNTKQQALDRAGGKHGNKGDEAAMTALKMLAFQLSI